MERSTGFSPISENDHAGNVWIVTILSLIYAASVALLRAYIKFRMYGCDDVLLGLATLLHVAQAIAVFIGLNNGLGKYKSITAEEAWSTSSAAFLATEVLSVLALALAKCSILALVLRIIGTRTGKSRPFCVSLMALSAAWGVGSALALLINCRGDKLLATDNIKQCPGQSTRWAAITAVDMATEVMTWLLVALLSSTVNMSLQRKGQVVLAFSFRLPLIPLSALHLSHFNKYPGSPEPQFTAANSVLFLQTMVLWSFISATVPNLKNFMKSFSIGMGLPVTFDISGYGSGNMYALQSMKNARSKATASAVAGGDGVLVSSDRDESGVSGWRNDPVSRNTTVIHRSETRNNPGAEERSPSRTGSQELIINKEVVWTVTYD